jgi:hypothetical protein
MLKLPVSVSPKVRFSRKQSFGQTKTKDFDRLLPARSGRSFLDIERLLAGEQVCRRPGELMFHR